MMKPIGTPAPLGVSGGSAMREGKGMNYAKARLLQAEAEVLSMRAERTNCPYTRELLRAQSSLASLDAALIECQTATSFLQAKS